MKDLLGVTIDDLVASTKVLALSILELTES